MRRAWDIWRGVGRPAGPIATALAEAAVEAAFFIRNLNRWVEHGPQWRIGR